MVDTQAEVERVLEAATPKLRDTLRGLAGAPWDIVVAVFGLLPYDQWTAAKTLGLAQDGPVEDTDSGTRPVVPTELAREVIGALQAPLATSTLSDFRDRVRLVMAEAPTDDEASTVQVAEAAGAAF